MKGRRSRRRQKSIAGRSGRQRGAAAEEIKETAFPGRGMHKNN
jgi:hypothetical protein